MTEFPYQFQANFKFGPQFKEALVNVPAQSPEEMLQKLEWLTANAAKFVAAQAALLGVEENAPLAGNVQHVSVQEEPQYQQPAPAPQQNGGWGQPQQQAPPQFAQQGQQAPGPVCQHGPMVFRQNKPGANKTWKGYFCPTPQGTVGQCQPQFLPKG